MASLSRGRFYRLKLSGDGLEAVGEPEEVFRTTNRLRDMAIAPDGRTFYIVTDNNGRTLDPQGQPTRSLDQPGSLLEFVWIPGG